MAEHRIGDRMFIGDVLHVFVPYKRGGMWVPFYDCAGPGWTKRWGRAFC